MICDGTRNVNDITVLTVIETCSTGGLPNERSRYCLTRLAVPGRQEIPRVESCQMAGSPSPYSTSLCDPPLGLTGLRDEIIYRPTRPMVFFRQDLAISAKTWSVIAQR